MLSTIITPSASTSAKPRSARPRPKIRFTARIDSLTPGAVPEKDRVLEVVRADVGARIDFDRQVDRYRRQRVHGVHGERREDTCGRQVLRELRSCSRVTRVTELAVKIPPAGKPAHRRGAIAYIS